jgi:hypothetical protein
VPRAELVCRRVGDDGDGIAVQLSRPALRLMSVLAARTGRQLVFFHGEGNQSPTRRNDDIHVSGLRHMAHASVGVGNCSCEVETCHARRRSLGGGSL